MEPSMMPLIIVWKRIPDDISNVKPPFGMVDDVRGSAGLSTTGPLSGSKRRKLELVGCSVNPIRRLYRKYLSVLAIYDLDSPDLALNGPIGKSVIGVVRVVVLEEGYFIYCRTQKGLHDLLRIRRRPGDDVGRDISEGVAVGNPRFMGDHLVFAVFLVELVCQLFDIVTRVHENGGRADGTVQHIHVGDDLCHLFELSAFNDDETTFEPHLAGLLDLHGIRLRRRTDEDAVGFRSQGVGEDGIEVCDLHEVHGKIGRDGSPFILPVLLEQATPNLAVIVGQSLI